VAAVAAVAAWAAMAALAAMAAMAAVAAVAAVAALAAMVATAPMAAMAVQESGGRIAQAALARHRQFSPRERIAPAALALPGLNRLVHGLAVTQNEEQSRT
jgi:hypothetical protein